MSMRLILTLLLLTSPAAQGVDIEDDPTPPCGAWTGCRWWSLT